jgi:hypothetical protein
VWGYAIAIRHSCKVHRRTGGPGVRCEWGAGGRLQTVQMCCVARASVARWPMSRGSSVCFLCKPIVTMLETIHTHHRAVQTISTPTILHIRSFTNTFCGIYHYRNHCQLWRVGSRYVTMLETIHTHHRAVQTIYAASIRNHRQLWRLGSRDVPWIWEFWRIPDTQVE